jgi:hypothetical protein
MLMLIDASIIHNTLAAIHKTEEFGISINDNEASNAPTAK